MKKRCIAEAIGTFAIVFCPVALGAVSKLTGSDPGLLAAALASGLPVLAMIYALGPISAHFNPAVTVAFALAGRFPWRHAPSYIASQLCGALAAGGVSALLFGPGGGVHIPASPDLVARNVGLEGVITFLLMFVIIATATDRRTSPVVPALAIGMTVIFGVLIGGPVTGGAMNPARAFGAAAFGGWSAFGQMGVYVLGPLTGAAAAVKAYEAIRLNQDFACSAPELEGE